MRSDGPGLGSLEQPLAQQEPILLLRPCRDWNACQPT